MHISPACALPFGNTTSSLKRKHNPFCKPCARSSTDRKASNRESHYFTWTFMGQVKMLRPACLYVTFPSLINETFRQSRACAESSRPGRVWPEGSLLFTYLPTWNIPALFHSIRPNLCSALPASKSHRCGETKQLWVTTIWTTNPCRCAYEEAELLMWAYLWGQLIKIV